MARIPTVIHHPSELDGVQLLPGLRTPGRGRFALAPDNRLSADLTKTFEQRLNKHYFACGCETASLFTALALVGYVAWLGLIDVDFAGVRPWLTGVLVLVAAGAIGKFVGRLAADREFRRTVEDLKKVWRGPPRKTDSIATCG